jgi:putative FmdB family regulatory protein
MNIMPTYEYGCLDCGVKFELFASISQKEKGLEAICPKCGSTEAVQLFNNVNFVKSGSGNANTAFKTSGCCGPNSKSGCCG